MLALTQRDRSYQMPLAYPYLVSTEAIEISHGIRSSFLQIQARLRYQHQT